MFKNPAIISIRPLHTLPGFFENGPKNNFSASESWDGTHGFNFTVSPFIRTSILTEGDSKYIATSPLNEKFSLELKKRLMESDSFDEFRPELASLFDTMFKVTSEFHSAGFVFGIQKNFHGFRVLMALPVYANITHFFAGSFTKSSVEDNPLADKFSAYFKTLLSKDEDDRSVLENDLVGILEKIRTIYIKMAIGAYLNVDFPIFRGERTEIDLSPSIYVPFNNKSCGQWKYLDKNRSHITTATPASGEESEMVANYFDKFLQDTYNNYFSSSDPALNDEGVHRFFSHFASIAQSLFVSRLAGPISHENLSLGLATKTKYRVTDSGSIKLYSDFKANYDPDRTMDWLIFTKNVYDPTLATCSLDGSYSINSRSGCVIGQNGVALKFGYDFYKHWPSRVKFVFDSYNRGLMEELGSDKNLSKELCRAFGGRSHKLFTELNWNWGGERIHAMASLGMHFPLFSKENHDDMGITMTFKFEY